MSLTASMFAGRLMPVMEDDGNRANVERKGMASTETDGLASMPSGSQPVPTQKPLVEELPTSIPIAVHHALAQRLEVLGDVSEGENARNDDFEREKDEQDPLLEENND